MRAHSIDADDPARCRFASDPAPDRRTRRSKAHVGSRMPDRATSRRAATPRTIGRAAEGTRHFRGPPVAKLERTSSLRGRSDAWLNARAVRADDRTRCLMARSASADDSTPGWRVPSSSTLASCHSAIHETCLYRIGRGREQGCDAPDSPGARRAPGQEPRRLSGPSPIWRGVRPDTAGRKHSRGIAS